VPREHLRNFFFQGSASYPKEFFSSYGSIKKQGFEAFTLLRRNIPKM